MKEWKIFRTVEECSILIMQEKLTDYLNDIEQIDWNILNVISINLPPFNCIFFIIAWKEKEINSENKEGT